VGRDDVRGAVRGAVLLSRVLSPVHLRVRELDHAAPCLERAGPGVWAAELHVHAGLHPEMLLRIVEPRALRREQLSRDVPVSRSLLLPGHGH